MRWTSKNPDLVRPWFAWRPVRIRDGLNWVWLEWITRQRLHTRFYSYWYYEFPNED